MAIEKVVRDGKVAVLVSTGYGAGWYTWNTGLGEQLVFCPQMVEAVLAGRDATEEAKRLFPNAYHGGVSDLKVEWLDVGARFEIQEYDGFESIRVFVPNDGLVA